MRSYVEAWRDGVQLQVPSYDGDDVRLPLSDGAIDVDGSTSGVRRTLNASFAPVAGLWDALSPIGTELKAFTVLRFPDGTTEEIPQGVFVIDVQSMGYAANGDIKVTAPDRWLRVLNGRFLTPRAATRGMAMTDQVALLLEEVMPAGVGVTNSSTATGVMPKQTWDRDRSKAIQDIAEAASLDVVMGRDGTPLVLNERTLSDTPVWDVDAGEEGVLVAADRERNRQRTYNIVVVNSSANPPKFATQFVWDNNPASPTYAGSGTGASGTPPAASSAGPFGQRPFFFSSPLLADIASARAAGATLLAKVSGLAAQITLTSVCNPALEYGDTIRVTLPAERRDLPRPVERHLVDAFTIPLFPQRQAQRIRTRSTVADIAES